MTHLSRPARSRTAVVLSGGGAYGAFSVGVMKALFAGRSPATNFEPLEADIFTGTSVGAFNAAVMVARSSRDCYANADRLERIWIERVASQPGGCGNGVFRIRANPFDIANPSCLVAGEGPVLKGTIRRIADDGFSIGTYLLSRTINFVAGGSLETAAAQALDIASFVDASRFSALLKDVIDPAAISSSELHLRIVATNWVTGLPTYFDNSDFTTPIGLRALMASAAVPGIFPPVHIGQDTFVDGGVVENTPLKPAISLGATELHVIYLDPDPKYIPISGQSSTVNSLLRTYYMMMAAKLSEDIASASWINEGLLALRRYQATGNVSPRDADHVVRAASKLMSATTRPLQVLTVHRYFPNAALGGDLGYLNFAADSVERIVREGERVGLTHDCADCGCLVYPNWEHPNA